MARTVVGLFDSHQEAQRAYNELVQMGIDRNDISVVSQEKNRSSTSVASGDDDDSDAGTGAAVGAGTGAVVGGAAGLFAGLTLVGATIPVIGPVIAAGPLIATLAGAGVGAATGGLIGALVGAGVPEHEARLYEEGVRRGGTLLTVRAEDRQAEQAAQIMTRSGAIDIQRRGAEWRSDASTATTRQTQTSAQTRQVQPGEQARIPVVEEEVQVGKRKAETGGVRVKSHVTEKPVQETVSLHEERVNVERRPVDRPAHGQDLSTSQDETIEVRETREVPVVQKTARVVEEVVVSKEARDRQQTIQETARRKDVEVEKIGNQPGESGRGFEAYTNEFRSNFDQAYVGKGLSFEHTMPAYRYGYNLGGSERYRGKDWNAIEPDARRDWESHNPGTWEKFKDAVRYGWDRVAH